MSLTQRRLKEYLFYDKDTGKFYWIKNTGPNCSIGDEAGWVSLGYRHIQLLNKSYPAHRLAWLYMEGYLPEHDVHHRDDNGLNNKWDNLEHLNRSCHLKTRNPSKANKSGIIGVCYNKRDGLWQMQIAKNKNERIREYYKNFNDAVKARYKYEVLLGYFKCKEKSTAFLYLKENGLL